MQSLTSAHPSLHSEARRPTPSPMDTIRARREANANATPGPNRMRVVRRVVHVCAFPGSRFRFRKQRRPAFGHACSGSTALTSHSLNRIPHLIAVSPPLHSARATPSHTHNHLSFPRQTHHYTYPQYRPLPAWDLRVYLFLDSV